MLLNAGGYWLKGVRPEQKWGFMFPERSQVTFQREFPAAWQAIYAEDAGQIRLPEGLFTFATVFPFRELKTIEDKISRSGATGQPCAF